MDTKKEIVNETAAKIAELNDKHRQGNSVFYTITSGVMAQVDVSRVISRVRTFSAFDESNDPHGEHDFGRFVVDEETLFWKIDYYDQELKQWCNPLDGKCRRVLTIMLADEY